MNTNAVNPEARLNADPPSSTESRRTALRRPVQDGMVAGVAAGLAGLLLIPEDGSEVSIAGSLIESLRSRSR